MTVFSDNKEYAFKHAASNSIHFATLSSSTANVNLEIISPTETSKEQQLTSTSKIIKKDTVHLVISYHCSTFLGALGSFSKPAFSLGIGSQ